MSQWSRSSTSGSEVANNVPPQRTSRLETMRAQIQQKQMQEKEQKLFQMLDSQQQRAMQKANLSGVVPPKYANGNGPPGSWATKSPKTTASKGIPSGNTSINSTAGGVGAGAGKVRQMFEDRRKVGGPPGALNGSGGYSRGLVGIDKSYPLDPLDVSKATMSRSGSSKSDPPSNSYARGRLPVAGMKPPQVPQQQSRSKPLPRPTPTPPPVIGNKQRGLSLDRNSLRSESEVSSTPSPVGKSGRTEVGIRRSSSGFGFGNSRSQDENANELILLAGASSPPPIIPKTTKYRDYADDVDSSLNKMRQMNITSPAPSTPSEYISSSASSSSQSRRIETKSFLTQQDSRSQLGKPTNNLDRKSSNTALVRKTSSKEKPSSPTKRSVPPPGLEECHICHRNFASDRISKHESICKKTKTKKRKVFDPTKMRMAGTEAEPYLRQVSAKPNKKAAAAVAAPAAKKVDWRKKHEDFINTIRAAKVYTQHVAAGGNPADLPPPPPTDTSDYIQCPHCGRKFNQGAAERHIPKCNSIRSNKR